MLVFGRGCNRIRSRRARAVPMRIILRNLLQAICLKNLQADKEEANRADSCAPWSNLASGQRSEARGQRPEVRGQRSEARGQRPEVRGQRAEGGGRKIKITIMRKAKKKPLPIFSEGVSVGCASLELVD